MRNNQSDEESKGSSDVRDVMSWPYNMGPLMWIAVLCHPIAFSRGDFGWMLLDYVMVLFVYLGFFFDTPRMLARLSPPGDTPRAAFVLLGGLAPWLLAFIVSDRLTSNQAVFAVFWPIFAWSGGAILLADRQRQGPMGPLTRAFLAGAIVMVAAAFLYPFVRPAFASG